MRVFLLTHFLMSVLLSQSYASASKANCPAPQSMSQEKMSGIDLQNFISDPKNKIKSVEDFICCLPASYRSNYAVAHTSKETDQLDPKNARVILFSPGEGSQNLTTVISIGSGRDKNDPHGGIGLMIMNPRKDEVEFFDVQSIESKLKMSGANPESCIQCHGSEGVVRHGGPKPIFDPSVEWVKFVDGLPMDHCSETEQRYLTAVKAMSVDSVKSNSRFKCLSSVEKKFDDDNGDAGTNLMTLDDALDRYNSRRIAKLIKQTPDYDRYKFAILGVAACDPGDFSNWLPESILKQHNNVQYLTREARESSNVVDTYRSYLVRSQLENENMLAKQQESLRLLREGKTSALQISTNELACEPVDDEGVQDFIRNFKSEAKGSSTLQKYRLDAKLRSFRGSQFDPHLRFLFEARGISVADWSMDTIDGTYRRSPFYLFEAITDLEPNGPLKASWQKFLVESRDMSDEKYDQFCNQLREMSMQAFQKQPGKAEEPAQSSKGVN